MELQSTQSIQYTIMRTNEKLGLGSGATALSRMCKALNSIPSPRKRKKKIVLYSLTYRDVIS